MFCLRNGKGKTDNTPSSGKTDKQLGANPWPEHFPTFLLESELFKYSILEGFKTDFKNDPVPKKVFTIDPKKITKEDALIIVDMQNDFIAPGGSFGVEEGRWLSGQVADLIGKFKKAGAEVCAMRDYHTDKHASFRTNKNDNLHSDGDRVRDKGDFPPHCVYNTKGAELDEVVAEAVQQYPDIQMFYKGFDDCTDSFGAFPYPEDERDSG